MYINKNFPNTKDNNNTFEISIYNNDYKKQKENDENINRYLNTKEECKLMTNACTDNINGV